MGIEDECFECSSKHTVIEGKFLHCLDCNASFIINVEVNNE